MPKVKKAQLNIVDELTEINIFIRKIISGDFSTKLKISSKKDELTELRKNLNQISQLLVKFSKGVKKTNLNLKGEVEKAEGMLQSIINLLPTRIFWKDKDLKYLGCNLAFAQDAGFKSPLEVIGKDDSQMPWKKECKLYQAADLEVIKTGLEKRDFEEPQTGPGGKKIWLLTSKVPLYDIQGKASGVLGTYIDISHRRKQEEILKKSEFENRMLALIAENSSDAIIGKKIDGTIISWNLGAEKVYGYNSQEVIGRSIEIIVPENKKTELKNILKEIIKGKSITNLETKRKRKDGKIIDVSLTISPIQDEAKKVMGVSAISRDITKEKENLSQLKKINKLMIGRELKMIELKEKIRKLEKRNV